MTRVRANDSIAKRKVVASLDHPHICALYDVGHDEGVAYLVMQYLEGETLAKRLARWIHCRSPTR